MSKAKLVTTIDLCLTSEDSQTADSDISTITNAPTMLTDQDKSPYKKCSEKSDSDSGRSSKKTEKRKESDSKDKPRIVLTFRSEKLGAKSSSMKIVSTEEKHEEISPRRSTRLGTKGESDYECEVTIKSKSQPVSEAEELLDNSPTKRPQRSTRSRNHDTDHWNSKKDAQSDVSTSSAQRPSRRIKPTAKVLANQEMQGDTQHRSLKDGVRTRSTRSATKSASYSSDRKYEKEPTPEVELDESQSEKLEHLEGLGLKAKEGTIKTQEDDSDEKIMEVDYEDQEDGHDSEEEVDDDLDVIKKLLEEEDDSEDEDFIVSNNSYDKPKPHSRPRRRAAPTYKLIDMTIDEHSSKRKKLRSAATSDEEDDEEDIVDEPEADTAEESQEAAQPDAGASIFAACHCLRLTNIHAAPEDLTEPVFCQAIDSVDGVRVGCSHSAARDGAGRDGELRPLLRAGPRTPFVLACRLHENQLRRHMCCPTCGLFCTQGSFYQCSLGHLFHVECGVAGAGAGAAVGCPHCGMRGGGAAPHAPLGAPANCDVTRVSVRMNCSNKKLYLPNQRQHCTPAFLSFTSMAPVQVPEGPIIPEDLLTPSTVDYAKLCEQAETFVGEESEVMQNIVEGIIAGETTELVPKVVNARKLDINKAVDSSGNTLCHIAATHGKLFALHLLRGAGANIDAVDTELRTPLIAAIHALLDKSSTIVTKDNDTKKAQEQTTEVEEIKMEVEEEESEESEVCLAEVKAEIQLVNDSIEDSPTKKETDLENDKQKKELPKDDQQLSDDKPLHKDIATERSARDEDILKAIRYLIAAGADADFTSADGTSALHVAAGGGGAALCRLLLEGGGGGGGGGVDPRDGGGWTPLHHAADHDQLDALQVLLSHGASPTARDEEGNAALHWACARGSARCLAALLRHAPLHLHLPNAAGDTPLHIACRQDHYECEVLLLARGARTDLENSVGELPIDVSQGASRACVSLHMQAAIGAGARHVEKILSDDISNGREPYPIPCVNAVDAAPAPDDFTYVAELLTPSPVPIDNTMDTMKGCACVGGGGGGGACGGACACAAVSVRRWYRGGRLRRDFPLHDPPLLFECNATCSCNPKLCTNNPVTRLLKTGSVWVPCAVYRVGGARGWGLRCTAPVPRGAPVAAYTGELLHSDDADRREPDHYMFAIDVKPDLLEQCAEQRLLCVDAARWGGAARFMNHSCAPALVPLRVLAGARDLRAATIALFAAADLPAHTPLTFDYGDKFWSVKSKFMSCECGEPDCRYPTKTTEDIES